MKPLVAVVFATLSSLVASAHAAQPKGTDYQAMYDQCIAKSGPIDNNTVLACSEGTSEAAKKEMNALYDKLHAAFLADAPGDAAVLEQSQKAWVRYRNTQCQLAFAHVGTPMYGYCPMELNIRRVEELRKLLGR